MHGTDRGGPVLAVFRDSAGRMGLTPLQVCRVEQGGMEAKAARRIRPGQRLTLRGGAAAEWQNAVATWCDRDGEGWRVGLARAA